MRCPSIKTIKLINKVSDGQAKLIRMILTEQIELDSFESVRKYMKQSFNPSHIRTYYKQLLAIDEILDTFGIEVIKTNEVINSYFGNVRFEYINTGDTYCNTIVYDTKKDQFIITSWGSIVESNKVKNKII